MAYLLPGGVVVQSGDGRRLLLPGGAVFQQLKVSGALAVGLADLSVSSDGALLIAAQSSVVFDDASVAAVATLQLSAGADVTLEDLAVDAAGTSPISAALAVTLDDVGFYAIAFHVEEGEGAGFAHIVLSDLTLDAFNAPTLTRLGNRRLLSSSPRLRQSLFPPVY